MTTLRRLCLCALPAAFLVLDSGAARADTLANMRDLGYLAIDTYNDKYSVGVAVNDAGLVAGNSLNSNSDEHAVLLDHGTVTDIGVLGAASESQAVDINEAGDVVGTSDPYGSRSGAFLYHAGVLTALGFLPGGNASEAVAINDSGLVAGNSTTATSSARSFVWQNGTMTDLGDLGGDESRPTAINNAGQVCGYAYTATELHAYRYSGGAMGDLGTLGGSRSIAFDINEAGDVTGSSWVAGDVAEHAVRWHAGMMQDLGTLGGTYASGYFINEAGDVAGSSLVAGNTEYHPFVYRNGTMIDIGTPGAVEDTPVAINEDGDVLGYTIEAGSYAMHSWVYSQGVKRDIGSLAGGSTFVSAWNSNGLITGSSDDANGDDLAILTLCPMKPATGCSTAATASLTIRDDAEDAKDKLLWKWGGSGPLLQSDFGSPDTSSGYRLCTWDSTTSADALVSAVAIPAGSGWQSKAPAGWTFRDRTGAADGVGMVRLATGGSGSASILVKAAGSALPLPSPHGPAEFFDADPRVTVQLARDEGTHCWGTAFAASKSNSATKYRATLP